MSVMTITTSKGKTYTVNWASAMPDLSGEMRLQIELADGRPIAEIADDFDGCERIRRQSEAEGDVDYEGYTVLIGCARPAWARNRETVKLALIRPESR